MEKSIIKYLHKLFPSERFLVPYLFGQPPCPGHVGQLNTHHFHLILFWDSSRLEKILHIYNPLLTLQWFFHSKKHQQRSLQKSDAILILSGSLEYNILFNNIIIIYCICSTSCTKFLSSTVTSLVLAQNWIDIILRRFR